MGNKISDGIPGELWKHVAKWDEKTILTLHLQFTEREKNLVVAVSTPNFIPH
jgi:hypothetical protein